MPILPVTITADTTPDENEPNTPGQMEIVPLPNKQIMRSEYHHAGLRRLALHCHKSHGRSLRSLTDRFRIRGVILLTLHEWINVSSRDQPNLLPELCYLARPVMRALASFHRDDAAWERREEYEELVAPK